MVIVICSRVRFCVTIYLALMITCRNNVIDNVNRSNNYIERLGKLQSLYCVRAHTKTPLLSIGLLLEVVVQSLVLPKFAGA